MKAAIYTLGCKVNQYESEALRELLSDAGIGQAERGAEVCIVNTCAVTAESERKCRQTVRRAVKENPGAYVLVTGCAGQVNADGFARIKGVDFVNGNRDKKALVAAILRYEKTGMKTRSFEAPDLSTLGYEEMRVSSSERTRAYIKIEDGCESRCAYCIIPRARGPIVSRPIGDCLDEAKRLARAGYREIVLTGIEVSAYGKDIGLDLADLLVALEEVEGIERIRLSSIDPSFLRPRFIDRIAPLRKFAPHFHLSLQSGCDETLAAMRRRYNTAMALGNIACIREKLPDVRFTADVIVGFPGETEEHFEKTCAFLSELELLHVHVFAYSRRPGTEADKMKNQIDEQTKSSRSARLIAHCDGIRDRVLAREEGRVYPVLFESGRKGLAVGHTPNFIEVAVKTECDLSDRILPVRLGKSENGVVYGTVAANEGEF